MLGAGAISMLALGLAMVLAKGVLSARSPDAAVPPGALDSRDVTAGSRVTADGTGQGLAALSRAAAENKYLFAFVWKVEDGPTAAMRQVVESATAKVAERARTVSLRADDPAASVLAGRYDLRRAPMPLVLAIAPNGAITGGFPTQVQEQDLLGALTTPGTEKCMKALQDGKLVFLCIQNESTAFNQEALQGVQEIQADQRYAGTAEIVRLDPRDPAETSFLGDLKIDPQTVTAITAVMVPPSKVVAKYEGTTTKEQLISALEQADVRAADSREVANGSPPPVTEGTGQGMAASSQAAAENKYLFAFFWNAENDQTAAMRTVVETAAAKVADRALTVSVRVDDPAERGIVQKYDLARAPMPLVLAIAPNGAVTGGFPTQVSEHELLNAFTTPSTQKCLKALQDGRLVFLCVQNESTAANLEALFGVREFQADQRYADATTTVVLDPRDPAETPFLQDLNIDPQTATAVTAFLAPPGSVIGTYQGATSKGQLIAALQQANTNCGPEGCGPDGCAPR